MKVRFVIEVDGVLQKDKVLNVGTKGENEIDDMLGIWLDGVLTLENDGDNVTTYWEYLK